MADGRAAAKDMFRKGLLFGTVFCHWMIKFSNPGSGTHCGGLVSDEERPVGPFDTDRLGRPFGWSKIFVVDASVLPSIPGNDACIAGHGECISHRKQRPALID